MFKNIRKGGTAIQKLKRNILINFRVSEPEQALIAEKMLKAGISNKEAYLRKMVLDGFVVNLDFSAVRELSRLLRSATNNLNQIAKRANETRNIYESDIKDLQDNYEKVWDSMESVMKKLASM